LEISREDASDDPTKAAVIGRLKIPELLAGVHVHVEFRRTQRELRTVRGILPACSHCEKIRDEQGKWHAIESSSTERSEAEFSHESGQTAFPSVFPTTAWTLPRRSEVLGLASCASFLAG